jgi:Ca-activated chloride channel family protein
MLPRTPASTGSSRPPAAIVLLSDGASTEGAVGPERAARQARQRHIPIYTVSLGTDAGRVVDPGTGRALPVRPDPASLARLARLTGGKAYTAATAGQLDRVYATIGTQIGSEQRAQDVAVAFLAAGGALVLVAGALSLRLVGSFA